MFRDREEGARFLAKLFHGRKLHNPLVLAIPRGGVVTGSVLAREIGAELNVVLSRKLRAPFQPELAIGALTEEGHIYLNEYGKRAGGVNANYLKAEKRLQMEQLQKRKHLIRTIKSPSAIQGRTIIVTDDGIATGSTIIAALMDLRDQKPFELIVATPVAPPDCISEIKKYCDDFLCVSHPEIFFAISQFYETFPQVEDQEVVELLRAPLLPDLFTIQVKGYSLSLIAPGTWRLPPTGKMRVGVHLIGSKELIEPAKNDLSIEQARDVASLPGVIDPVLTMPDMHQGYGFPIGGVAAFDADEGVVSPGGVGYDINCGVRVLKTPLQRDQIHYRSEMRALVSDLFENIPTGVGSRRQDLKLEIADLKDLLRDGVHWALKNGFASNQDLEVIEEGGRLPGADPDCLSEIALKRGLDQLGTLGSGNHFVEVQYVDAIYNEPLANAFGLHSNQVIVMIHTGSRGLGYQVCEDYLSKCLEVGQKYGIQLPNAELASVPLKSVEGRSYLAAMAAAANFAFTNRQLITYWVRRVFENHFGEVKLELLYDVCHNIAKFEDLPVNGKTRKVFIHRKGATRAYPPHHPKVPKRYQETGQPILIPGDMGRYSFILAGTSPSLSHSFGSACHGAGREVSRHKAKQIAKGRPILRELEDSGIYVKASGYDTVAEEIPEAYKDASRVVEAIQDASIAQKVVRLRPMGVIKG